MHWVLFSFIFVYNKIAIPQTELGNEPTLGGNDNHLKEYKNESDIETFRKNKYRLNRLRYLEKQYISILEKIQVIEQEKDSIYGPNIHAGGLWKDWDW
jgi:hypothetical protein